MQQPLLPADNDWDSKVKPERTGWRDLALSQRHRLWGWHVPVVDIDQFLEYDSKEPVALIEYKREGAPKVGPEEANVTAMARLGTRAHLPVFGVVYKPDFSLFVISPVNDYSRQHLTGSVAMSEADFVTFLYALRGRQPPQVVLQRIGGAP